MNWVWGTFYPGVKCPRGQDTVPTVGDKISRGGDILPRGKVSPGTIYQVVSCPRGQDTRGKIPGGQDKPVHRHLRGTMGELKMSLPTH